MADTEPRTQFAFRVNQHELDVIARAAQLAGFDVAEIATWVRSVVLERASGLVAQHERQSLAATLKDVGYEVEIPAASGTCACGQTRDARGNCDGSCVMRL